jgi:hypothetical protein
MDDANIKKARTMAQRGVAALDGCRETGNWPLLFSGIDFSTDAGTPAGLIAPNSRLEEALGILGITHQDAHNWLFVRRGDIPAPVATDVWRTIAAERMLEGART